MEYTTGGTLGDYRNSMKPPEPTIVRILHDLCETVKSVNHSNHIIHRDIKSENLQLGPNNKFLLTDFGLALYHKLNSADHRNTHAGTPYFMAPEIRRHRNGHDHAADIWSIGMLVLIGRED